MENKQVILFDLDGTVTDSALGITKSIAYALEHYQIPVPPLADLRRYVGPPLAEAFQEDFGMSPDQSLEAVDKFREYYAETGIYENQVYEGMEDLLKTLHQQKRQVVMATSKPEVFAHKVLKHFDLDGYFDFVSGALMYGVRADKLAVMKHALDIAGVEDLSRAVMVGDRRYDMMSARQLHMDSIGVLYGYGSRPELEEHQPTFLVDTVDQLARCLGA